MEGDNFLVGIFLLGLRNKVILIKEEIKVNNGSLFVMLLFIEKRCFEFV